MLEQLNLVGRFHHHDDHQDRLRMKETQHIEWKESWRDDI